MVRKRERELHRTMGWAQNRVGNCRQSSC
jgi:hypothetical protein